MAIKHITTPYELLVRWSDGGVLQGAHVVLRESLVDDTNPGTIAREPRTFAGCQRTVLRGGTVTPDFAQRIFALWRNHRGGAGS